MTELYLNGEHFDDEESFLAALNESQDRVIDQENKIKEEYDVSSNTASAIFYLRSRSRWTLEKENELVERDHANNPIPLGAVLAGKF